MEQKTSFKSGKSTTSSEGESNGRTHIMALDIGTSNIRCHIYNKQAEIVGRSCQVIKILYPEERGAEIDPDNLWDQVMEVMKSAIENANLTAQDVASLGISVQRSTFILWNKETGVPYHNFIVWQDTRAEHIEKSWNESYIMKLVKGGGKLAHSVTRQKRFMAAAVINFRTNHVTIRVLWVLEKFREIRKLAKEGKVRFGTLETWLIWKLTKGKVYASEMSNASSTGFYDPYIREWSSFFSMILNIPLGMFPEVWDSDSDFGSCHPDLFGAEIPIRAALGDQQSAMFGQCCFEEGHVKLTMGTGAFMNINIGPKPHASVEGFYPVTGWKRGSKIVHLAEGSSHTAGDAVDWLVKLLSIESPAATESIAESVEDTDGIYFVPAFSGLQAPDNDFSACGLFLGIKSSSSKAHFVRALLEALAFKNVDIFRSMTSEISFPIKRIVCDGGVTANNFVMQLTADLIGKPIHRMRHSDMSALGAAFMAGRAVGLWKSDRELQDIIQTEKTFEPNKKRAEKYIPIMKEWRRAVERSKRWYEK